MKILKILFPILLFSILFSCDKVDEPLKPQEGTCGDASIQPIKKILVEKFTGVKCTNCPNAAETLHEIKDDYCDYVIPVAIHVGYFATPNNQYTDDFRTEEGEEIGGGDGEGRRFTFYFNTLSFFETCTMCMPIHKLHKYNAFKIKKLFIWN